MTHADELKLRSRLLFVVALLALALATLWAVRTPPAPNSDRYDYAGRAYHALQGDGLRAHVVYPLRLALPDAGGFPPSNLSRPPLWPALLVPLQMWGLDDRAGVILAGVLAIPLLLLVRRVGDATFGASAGAVAGLAVVGSFATVRAIWGGGPEVAMALITFLLWTWAPAAQGLPGYLACGSVYGLLPLLHPVGWLYAMLAFGARSHRYSRTGRMLVLTTALLVASPWYLSWWATTGAPTGFVQGQAELAKAVHDPGGLGPYRTLTPVHGSTVLRENPGAVARTVAHRLKERVLRLDAWMGWLLVAAALVGARSDPALALRDAITIALGFAALAPISGEARLALPLLPVAATWCGAGVRAGAMRWPRLPWFILAVAATALPWGLPAGRAMRPGDEFGAMPKEQRDPPPEVVTAVGAAGDPQQPMFTDSGVLAWRSRRPAIFLPQDPHTLARIRLRPDLAAMDVVVLGGGRSSRWLDPARPAWTALLAASSTVWEGEAGPLVARLVAPDQGATASSVPQQPVGPGHPLAADEVPPELVELAQPPAIRSGLLLRPEAAAALDAMVQAARDEGIHLRVVSAYRSFQYQERLHANAVARHGADQKWVARPGESEHQLGTAVDLADGALAHSLEQSFGETEEGKWVARRGPEFGFAITYTDSTVQATGILPEPWHIRYRGAPESQ